MPREPCTAPIPFSGPGGNWEGLDAPSGCRLIVNGDDFGRSPEINEAILEGHCRGVLTSASLMVTGSAIDHAVHLAHTTPSLAVGLHLVLVDGQAALPFHEIPQLVDTDGRFLEAPIRAGLRYWFRPAVRRQLVREIQAQFSRFAATGLPLAHVDGHLHFHLHPAVFPTVAALAERYGARRIRVPNDRLLRSLRHDPRHVLAKVGTACVFGLLGRWCRRQLRRYRLVCAGRTYGLMQSGSMDEAYVLGLLEQLSDPLVEIYFHPSTGRRLDRLGPNPEELAVLLSPRVHSAIREQAIRLTGNLTTQRQS